MIIIKILQILFIIYYYNKMNISKKDIITIIVSAVVLVGVDFFYLSSTSKFFNNIVKNIQGKEIQFKMLGAVICYVFLVLGLNYFVLLDKKLGKKEKIFKAFMLGLIIYGVFESTNLAIFTKWTLDALLLDTLWGSILFSITTYITLILVK